MKILICGLPGTGKTTLTKTRGEQFNIKTISDWDIFYQWEIKIDKFEDKKNVSKKYSKLLMEEIFKFDNIIEKKKKRKWKQNQLKLMYRMY